MDIATFDALGGELQYIELAAKESSRLLTALGSGGIGTSVVVNPFLAADPALVATAANLFKALQQGGVQLTVSPTATENTIGRLHASGLNALLSTPASSPTTWLIPVQNFVTTDPHVMGVFASTVANILPPYPDKIDRLYQSLCELTENVRVHSQCPWGGFFCANVPVHEEGIVRISVADFGVGVHRTLSPVFPYNANLAHDVVIYEAFKYWVTGKPGQRAGSGLPYACEFVKEIGGVIRAYSGTGCIRVDNEDTCLLSAGIPYPGTIITIDLPLG